MTSAESAVDLVCATVFVDVAEEMEARAKPLDTLAEILATAPLRAHGRAVTDAEGRAMRHEDMRAFGNLCPLLGERGAGG